VTNEWHNDAHIDRRAKLADDLLTGANQLEVSPNAKCDRCDPDVGYVCECCFSARAMREAASYLRAMNQAVPHPALGEPGEARGEQ
jgi:hypothetical protein